MALIQFKKLYTIDGAPFRLLSSEEKILLDNSFCFPEPHTYIPGLPLLKKNQKKKNQIQIIQRNRIMAEKIKGRAY
jgi:hypothetical protein